MIIRSVLIATLLNFSSNSAEILHQHKDEKFGQKFDVYEKLWDSVQDDIEKSKTGDREYQELLRWSSDYSDQINDNNNSLEHPIISSLSIYYFYIPLAKLLLDGKLDHLEEKDNLLYNCYESISTYKEITESDIEFRTRHMIDRFSVPENINPQFFCVQIAETYKRLNRALGLAQSNNDISYILNEVPLKNQPIIKFIENIAEIQYFNKLTPNELKDCVNTTREIDQFSKVAYMLRNLAWEILDDQHTQDQIHEEMYILEILYDWLCHTDRFFKLENTDEQILTVKYYLGDFYKAVKIIETKETDKSTGQDLDWFDDNYKTALLQEFENIIQVKTQSQELQGTQPITSIQINIIDADGKKIVAPTPKRPEPIFNLNN